MARTRSAEGSQEGPLQTDRGNTIIKDAVVKAIVGVAANELDGARTATGGARVPGDSSRTVGEFIGGLSGGSDVRTRGISVEVGERETAVDLTVTVDYGRSVAQVSEAIRQNVIQRVENLTGLTVNEVNITVSDVILPQQQST
jgi:uncharacterized alkaline shock family protein YloU